MVAVLKYFAKNSTKELDIREFGARFGQDSSIGINRALSEAPNTVSRSVIIPSDPDNINNSFLLSTELVIPANIILKGVGWQASKLKVADGTNIDAIRLNGSWIALKDFLVDGNQANQASPGSCIYNSQDDCTFLRLKIENGRRGIQQQSANRSRIKDCWIVDNTRTGLVLGTDCTVLDCYIGSNGFDGSADDPGGNGEYCASIIIQGWDSRITHCHIWGTSTGASGGYGIVGHWSNDTQITRCVIEEHTKDGIYLNHRNSGWQITNNYIEDNSYVVANVYDGIRFNNDIGQLSYNNQICGNRFGYQYPAPVPVFGRPAKHRYCVSENNAGCDWNHVVANQMRDGYTTLALALVGAGSIANAANNMV